MPKDAHLQAVGEAQPMLHQQWLQLRLRGGKELNIQARLALLGFFSESEVRVRPLHTPTLDLAAHPHAIGERAMQRPVDRIGQFANRERGKPRLVVGELVACVVFELEVEGGLAHTR